MKYFPLAATAVICTIFFFLAAATSPPPDEEFVPQEVSAEVTLLDTSLILANTDTLDFVDATLQLTYETGDTLDGFPSRNFYRIREYALAAGGVDTVPLVNFVDFDMMPYPVDTVPFDFNLDFFDEATGTVGTFTLIF